MAGPHHKTLNHCCAVYQSSGWSGLLKRNIMLSMNPVPDHVNVTGRKEARDWPRVSPDDIGWCWQVTSDHGASGAPAITHHPRIFPGATMRLSQTRLSPDFDDEEYFEILKWHNLWCGEDTGNTIICHPSDIRHHGSRVCGHKEWLQWSLLIHTNITNYW